MVNTSERTLEMKLPVMPLSTSVLFFASLSLELDYTISLNAEYPLYIYIFIFNIFIFTFFFFFCWKIVGPLLAVQAIMPVLALPYTPIIMERGTFELICNGSKRPLVGLICDWSRRPRGHIPPPYSLNRQDSGTACEKYNSLLNNYLDLD